MPLSYAGPDLTARQQRLVRALEWLSRGRGIHRVQQRFVHDDRPETFYRRAASAFDLKTALWFAPRAWIPAEGPLLVVANHPFGVVDGLAISAMLESIRPDVRIIVWNAIGLPSRDGHFLPLDLGDETGTKSRRQNVAIRREATDHLRQGGCVVLFPSGAVETTRHPLAKPEEGPWTALACRLAMKSGATILPMYVHGHNSRLFHAASHLGLLVRRSLFLRETRRQAGARIACRVGEPIPTDVLQDLYRQSGESTTVLASRLRERTLRLASLPAQPDQWSSLAASRLDDQGIGSRSAPSFSTGIRSSLVTPMCSTVALATKIDE